MREERVGRLLNHFRIHAATVVPHDHHCKLIGSIAGAVYLQAGLLMFTGLQSVIEKRPEHNTDLLRIDISIDIAV